MTVLKGVKDQIDVKVTANLECDNGSVQQVPFVVTYKKPKMSEIKDLERRLAGEYDDQGNELVAPISDEELAREMILGWKRVPTSDGSEFEFNEENLLLMLDVREYQEAIKAGLLQVIFGRDSVLAKNSSARGRRGR